MNDIGLKKEIKHLLMPSRVTVPLYSVDCDQATTGDGESIWIETYIKTEDKFSLESKFHIVKYDSVYVAPADYGDGFITLPHTSLKSAILITMHSLLSILITMNALLSILI